MSGAKLTAGRRSLGLTQNGLAHALGVNPRSVQKWEAEDRPIPEIVARVMRLTEREPDLLKRLAA